VDCRSLPRWHPCFYASRVYTDRYLRTARPPQPTSRHGDLPGPTCRCPLARAILEITLLFSTLISAGTSASISLLLALRAVLKLTRSASRRRTPNRDVPARRAALLLSRATPPPSPRHTGPSTRSGSTPPPASPPRPADYRPGRSLGLPLARSSSWRYVG
jgi:hypothetical protein